jgi:hypothetical protein
MPNSFDYIPWDNLWITSNIELTTRVNQAFPVSIPNPRADIGSKSFHNKDLEEENTNYIDYLTSEIFRKMFDEGT